MIKTACAKLIVDRIIQIIHSMYLGRFFVTFYAHFAC